MSESAVHVVPVRTYVLIFAILMALTATTIWVAFQDYGALNNVIALTIAVIKMTLVILFFMHVRYATRLTWLVVVSGFVWLLKPTLAGRFGPAYHDPVECVGLYWHFVDIVWIFLFPLLYLIGRH